MSQKGTGKASSTTTAAQRSALRHRVRTGRYRVDPEAIAAALVADGRRFNLLHQSPDPMRKYRK